MRPTPTTAVYLLGAPGVGKSTVLTELITLTGWTRVPEVITLAGALKGQPMISPDGAPTGLYLGQTRPHFSGTDALAMNAHPAAIRWVNRPALHVPGFPTPALILGEGQRLATVSFLSALTQHAALTLVHLTAAPAALDQRCAQRGSNQAASWRKGAATRAVRTFSAVKPYAARAVEIDTTDLTAEAVAKELWR